MNMKTSCMWKSVLSAVVFIITASQGLAAGPCNIRALKQIQENVGALSPGEMESFFRTLNKSCAGNVEFSEWSNELMFSVLTNRPVVFIEALEKQPKETLGLVTAMLESPVHDGIDLQQVYTAAKGAKTVSNTKARVLTSLQVAAGKYGAILK